MRETQCITDVHVWNFRIPVNAKRDDGTGPIGKMIAAASEISIGCEFCRASYILDEGVLEELFLIENGQMSVKKSPVFGNRFDLDKSTLYALNDGDGGHR
ncbi:MAG: hypothetical protein ACU0DI_04685 [Paracoccaceae bacterium]